MLVTYFGTTLIIAIHIPGRSCDSALLFGKLLHHKAATGYQHVGVFGCTMADSAKTPKAKRESAKNIKQTFTH